MNYGGIETYENNSHILTSFLSEVNDASTGSVASSGSSKDSHIVRNKHVCSWKGEVENSRMIEKITRDNICTRKEIMIHSPSPTTIVVVKVPST